MLGKCKTNFPVFWRYFLFICFCFGRQIKACNFWKLFWICDLEVHRTVNKVVEEDAVAVLMYRWLQLLRLINWELWSGTRTTAPPSGCRTPPQCWCECEALLPSAGCLPSARGSAVRALQPSAPWKCSEILEFVLTRSWFGGWKVVIWVYIEISQIWKFWQSGLESLLLILSDFGQSTILTLVQVEMLHWHIVKMFCLVHSDW